MSKRRIAVFDLDGTLTKRDTYRYYLLGFILRNPGTWLNAALLPLDLAVYKLGDRDNSWLKERFLSRVLGGRSSAEIERWTRAYVTGVRQRGMRFPAVQQVRAHRDAGDAVVVATASFSFYVEALVEGLGVVECVCTEAEWSADKVLQGKISGLNCYGNTKLERVKAAVGKDREDTHVTAYSDHVSDLPLLTWADRGVFVNPGREEKLAATAAGLETVYW